MPTLSMFFGIVIRMFFPPKEHNPPHIHAEYSGSEAVFRVSDAELTSGKFPSKQTRLVQAWIEIHREELVADWKLCQSGEHPFRIDPLQ